MSVFAHFPGSGSWYTPAAIASLLAIAVSCASLLLLHLASPEFAPSWRMVSEYANGRHAWLLTLVFVGWAVASITLAAALLPLWSSTLGKIGLVALVLAAVGQTMGGLFDINHKLHGPAALIGIPALCIAAVAITMALARREDIAAPPFWSAHLPWISFALMIFAFALFYSALKAAGIDVSGETGPIKELPTGVSSYVGWANRILFATSYLWAALASNAVLWADHSVR